MKYSIVFLINFLGKPTDKISFVMHFASKLKSFAILFSVAKDHKFESVEEISLDNLKLCPVIDQRGLLFTIIEKLL